MFRALFLLSFLSFFDISTAYANERLRFQAIETAKEKQILNYASSIHKETLSTPQIAKIDLNGDLLKEFIIRPSCSTKRLCPHIIIALQDLKPVILGQFDAHKMLISYNKTYGIRDIILYNDLHNDFKSQTIRWSPFFFEYKGN